MNLLSGYRVLDFGRYIAAPYCGFLLAQLGAEVVRVERPGGHEDRYLIPVSDQGDGTLYLQMNANKKGLTLDMSKPEGKRLTKRLISSADIVLANLPAKTLQALELDYESLTAIKENIILVANSAFGSKGPYANHIGFDGMAQAMSGANFFSGLPGQPIRCTVNYLDFSTALAAALGALAAIMHREKTGEGQVVETSLLGTAMTLNNSLLMEQAMKKVNREPKGNHGQLAGPSDLFKTKDGHIAISVVGPYMFKRFTRLLNKPEWLSDERFKDDAARGEHNGILSEALGKWCGERTNEQALEALKAAKLPAGPVLSLQEALDHPMVQSLEHFEFLEYLASGHAAPIAKAPFQLSKTPLAGIRPAPGVGEHNHSVLRHLGYDDSQIAAFRAAGII